MKKGTHKQRVDAPRSDRVRPLDREQLERIQGGNKAEPTYPNAT